MKNLKTACHGLMACTVLCCLPLSAQEAKPERLDDTRAYFEVLRSKFNANKTATLTEVMQLTGAEAEKFWPIYRAYEQELAAVGDRKLELIREFFTYHRKGTLTDEKAKALAESWLQNLQDRTDLWKKYHQKLSKTVSPTRAAQFLQIENQIALFLDLSIASEMPTVGTASKPKP